MYRTIHKKSEMSEISEETYRIFEDAYAFFNERLFESQLPRCLITFQRQSRLMGYVSFDRWKNKHNDSIDELAINPEYFAHFPLTDIFQTLCHEMVHVWQAHFGSPTRSGYHNREWSDKMKSIGLMPSSTGEPGGKVVGQQMLDYVIDGGPFSVAVKDILDRGIELIWFDTISITPQPRAAQSFKNTQMLNQSADTQALQSESFEEIELGMDMDAVASAIEASLLQDLPSANITSRPHKRASKTKYYCSNCSSQVWGKPGIKLICGDCIKPFIEDS